MFCLCSEGIKRYFEKNKTLPGRILVYRDGVGEGMIPHVFDYELQQMMNAVRAMNPESPPKLSFTIVTKRVNSRFFLQAPIDHRDPSKGMTYENPGPGTIVDTTVTRVSRYDFYLVSQSVRQGTVSPTMYNIIYDQSGFGPSHQQQLAYKLTHLYYNWPVC